MDSIAYGNEIAGDWPSVFQSLLNEWRKDEFKVIKGICGNTTVNGFDRFNDDVIANLPCVLIMEFGLNDCNIRKWANVPRVSLHEFEKNLREFHRVCTSNGGQCVFIINHIITNSAIKNNGKLPMDNLKPYNEMIRTIAANLNSPTVDLPRIMQNCNIDLNYFVCEDGVHLSKKGTFLYAEMVFNSLMLFLSKINFKS